MGGIFRVFDLMLDSGMFYPEIVRFFTAIDGVFPFWVRIVSFPIA